MGCYCEKAVQEMWTAYNQDYFDLKIHLNLLLNLFYIFHCNGKIYGSYLFFPLKLQMMRLGKYIKTLQ
jgi:hypothetical protein